LAPGKQGTLRVVFDTTGKSGNLVRNIYLVTNDPLNPQKSVQVKGNIDNYHRLAGAGFQPANLFNKGCVSCHGDRGKGKLGDELYTSLCAFCHRTGGSAVALDNTFKGSRQPAALRQKIGSGIGKMPGFAIAHGGPLAEKQVESLVGYLSAPPATSAPAKSAPNH
jgi:mono/diheme cytochrome c family protein